MEEANPITTLSSKPPFKLFSDTQHSELQHLHSLLHLLHHRNHNQHRRSTWYRHFNLFRRRLSILLAQFATLKHVPTTNLARHKKKAEDAKLDVDIKQRLAFWRDVVVPKAQHAFGQLTSDARFAVLGVVLLAVLASVCRILGLGKVFEELGEEETRKVLEDFAAESWGAEGQDELFGVPVPRGDVGQVLERHDAEEMEDEDGDKARVTEKELRKQESACLAPERDILDQSREALKTMATTNSAIPPSISAKPGRKLKVSNLVEKERSATPTIRDNQPASPATIDMASVPKQKKTTSESPASAVPLPAAKPTKVKTKRPKEDDTASTMKPKKKRKKNAIDDLFAGL